SSISDNNISDVLAGLLAAGSPSEALARPIFGLAAVFHDGKKLPSLLKKVTQLHDGRFASWQMPALAGIWDALDRGGQPLRDMEVIQPLLACARQMAADDTAAEAERLAAIALLGREPSHREGDLAILTGALVPRSSPSLQAAAVKSLGRTADEHVPDLVLSGWSGHAPTLKSQILD